MQTMNEGLTFDDWFRLRNLDDGMMGPARRLDGSVDPSAPENPAVSMVRPRIVTLNPGTKIFRWVGQKSGTLEQKAASPWWSTRLSAQRIVGQAARAGSTTAHAARAHSHIARKWGNPLDQVLFAEVTKPVKCFMGQGRAIHDDVYRETWAGGGVQLYIPGMAEARHHNFWVLSQEAREHINLKMCRQASTLDQMAFDHWTR